MSYAKITQPHTQPGRLYAAMLRRPRKWFSPWDVMRLTGTVAPHTIISHVRAQARLESRRVVDRQGVRWTEYRLAKP